MNIGTVPSNWAGSCSIGGIEIVVVHGRSRGWSPRRRSNVDARATNSSPCVSRDLVHSLPAKHRRALIAKQRRHLNFLRDILNDGARLGVFTIADSRVTAFAIITMCEYVQSWYDPEGELSPEDIGQHYSDLVLSMVNGDRSARPTTTVTS